MKKNKPEDPAVEEVSPPGNNGHVDLSAIMNLLNDIKSSQRDMEQRMDDIEEGKSRETANAQRDLIHMIYNTPIERLPELTYIPNMASARVHAYGMALEAMDMPEYAGIPLSSLVRTFYFKLVRSVKGLQLGRGSRLAEEQAVAKSDADGEGGMDFGGE